MKRSIFCIVAVIPVLFTSVIAGAQQAPQIRFRGFIISFDDTTLIVQMPDGKTRPVAIPVDVRINANGRAKLSDIKPGHFVGSAADKGPDGKLHAEEVHIFPEAMRGTGEGHRSMGPDPNHSMTNGTVAINDPEARTMTNGTVSSANGMGTVTLMVKYKDGDQAIEIAPTTPVVTIIPGDRTLLKPGATVSVVAIQKDTGLFATIVTAEKDGVKPI